MDFFGVLEDVVFYYYNKIVIVWISNWGRKYMELIIKIFMFFILVYESFLYERIEE